MVIGFFLVGFVGDVIVLGMILVGLIVLWFVVMLILYIGYDYFWVGIGYLMIE